MKWVSLSREVLEIKARDARDKANREIREAVRQLAQRHNNRSAGITGGCSAQRGPMDCAISSHIGSR
jgi:hypothetical protein